jgi:hypothetical protein
MTVTLPTAGAANLGRAVFCTNGSSSFSITFNGVNLMNAPGTHAAFVSTGSAWVRIG